MSPRPLPRFDDPSSPYELSLSMRRPVFEWTRSSAPRTFPPAPSTSLVPAVTNVSTRSPTSPRVVDVPALARDRTAPLSREPSGWDATPGLVSSTRAERASSWSMARLVSKPKPTNSPQSISFHDTHLIFWAYRISQSFNHNSSSFLPISSCRSFSTN